jgi:hypothetical protein
MTAVGDGTGPETSPEALSGSTLLPASRWSGRAAEPTPGDPAGSREVRTRRATPDLSLVVVAVVAVAVGAGVRVWQIAGRGALGWNDTADFLAGSREPWTSLDLWAGARPPVPALLLKLTGGDDGAFVRVAASIAVLCWAALAVSVASAVASRWSRALAAAVVVAFSVTTPVTMWDRSVLSESLAVSTLALVVAAVVQLARGLTPLRVGLALAALVPWLATRDSHAVVALVGGAAVVAAAAVLHIRDRRAARATEGEPGAAPPAASRRAALLWLGVGAVALGSIVVGASARGERHAFPTRNVYEVRVLPYPDRVEWFADHGMPQAEVFRGPDARPPAYAPGMPPVVYVGDDDPELREWLAWVESDGRAAFARFVATHPLYLVAEPLRSPERAFNNALGDRSFYRALDMPIVPGVDRVLAPPTAVVLMVAALPFGWAIGRRRWPPLVLAGAISAGLAVPHGLLAWHSDGMETARHLVVPALQLHLGVLLMLIGVLADMVAVGRSGPAAPAEVEAGLPEPTAGA